MNFDEQMILDLRAVGDLLRIDDVRYLERQEALAKTFAGREAALEDIIYDFDDVAVRLEGMMVCKLMPSVNRLRVYEDLSLAEKDPELKRWAGILLRQEHLLETATRFERSSATAEQDAAPDRDGE